MSLKQQNSSQILQNKNHQYPVNNGEPKPFELSSFCSKRHPHVHLDYSDNNEDKSSHHEEQTKQLEKRQVARE
jgi:hypothetical protein